MKSFLVFIAGALVALSAAKDLRMKGAIPAKITDYPSMASLTVDNEFAGHGIILSKRVIMAPASSNNPSEVQVRVGSTEWAEGGQVAAVKNILQTEFVSFIILQEDLTFGPTVKAVRFTDKVSSAEYTKLQLVGWGYPTEDGDDVTDIMFVQNLPVMDQDECKNQNYELFENLPEYVPIYCVSETSSYGIFDEAIVPVFKNGAVEAFSFGREEGTSTVLLIHAQFVYHEMKMALNAMQAI